MSITMSTNSTLTTEGTLVHTEQSLKRIDKIEKLYHNNKNSDYTEKIEELGNEFEYSHNCQEKWLESEFSLLYGSHLYNQASETQKIALNHLYWICFYNYSIGGEITTMLFNQLTCGAFYHLGGYELLCRELDLETSQERVHVEAFQKIGMAAEIGLYGQILCSRALPHYLDAALIHPQRQKRTWVEKIPFLVNSLIVPNSPFLATHYYVLRGLRNIQLKVKEHQHLMYARNLEKQNGTAPAPSLVSHYHCLDEAFHVTTSRLISHDVYKDFPKPSFLERKIANYGVTQLQPTMNSLSGSIPGIFSDDAPYMPIVYKILQTPLFGFSAQEALVMLEKCFCEEHEGFHVGLKYHQKALYQNREYLAPIDYLSSDNRDLKIMAQASIGQSLKNNIAAFERFRSSLQLS